MGGHDEKLKNFQFFNFQIKKKKKTRVEIGFWPQVYELQVHHPVLQLTPIGVRLKK